MSKPRSAAPFVTKFLEPIIAEEQGLMLLRYQRDDGSKGCIGMRYEAFETLHAIFDQISKKRKNDNDTNVQLSCG